jgi:hypothetical protein
VRVLGLHLEPDLSWTVQIATALRNVLNALRNFQHILCNPHLHVDVKLLIIVCTMRFGMEVWFPRTPDEKQGVPRLHRVLVDALRESLGIARSHPMSYSRHNCKASVLLCDFALPSMSTEGDSALVRFYYLKVPPPLHPFAVVTISTPPLLPFYRPTALGGYTFKLSLPGCTRGWRS